MCKSVKSSCNNFRFIINYKNSKAFFYFFLANFGGIVKKRNTKNQKSFPIRMASTLGKTLIKSPKILESALKAVTTLLDIPNKTVQTV